MGALFPYVDIEARIPATYTCEKRRLTDDRRRAGGPGPGVFVALREVRSPLRSAGAVLASGLLQLLYSIRSGGNWSNWLDSVGLLEERRPATSGQFAALDLRWHGPAAQNMLRALFRSCGDASAALVHF